MTGAMTTDATISERDVARVASAFVSDITGRLPVDAFASTYVEAIRELYAAAMSYRLAMQTALAQQHALRVELERERERRFQLLDELRELRERGRALEQDMR